MSNKIETDSVFTILSATNGLKQNKFNVEATKPKIKSQRRNQMNEQSKISNIVGDIMWPIILFLKLSGHCPLSYCRTNLIEHKPKKASLHLNSDGLGLAVARQYTIKFKTYSLLWTTFCAAWMLYCFFDFARESINPTNEGAMGGMEAKFARNAEKGSILETLATTAQRIRLATVVIHATEVLIAWHESSSLGKFLNDCLPIQTEFQAIFPYLSLLGMRYRKLIRTRNMLLLLYVGLPSVFFVPVYVYGYWSIPYLTNFVLSFGIAWHVAPIGLMEDVKVFMTYKILAEAFSQIRVGITQSARWEKLTAEKVKSWSKIVHSVRLQVNQAGESQKNHQLLLVGGSIIWITGFTFLLLNNPWDVPGIWISGAFGASFLAFISGRLYLKILAANAVTREESLIAEELILVHPGDNDIQLEMEIKFLHDMITQNPSVISFGSYVILNKQLILGVASQVVTYIIVLMQFLHPG